MPSRRLDAETGAKRSVWQRLSTRRDNVPALDHSARHRHGPELRHDHRRHKPALRTADPALLVQNAPGRSAPRRALQVLAAATSAALIGTTLLAWSFAPALRERTLSSIDDRLTDGVNSLVADEWEPAPSSFHDFAEQTLQERPETPAYALDARDVARAVFSDRAKLPRDRALIVADTLVDEAQKVGVDPLLLLAVIDVESKFDHRATSYRGARGLMQLMPETRQWMIDRTPELWNEAGTDDSVTPESNVRVGVHYFAHLKRGFRTLEHVLQAYNCGPGRLVDILNGESELPEESKLYADRVLRIYSKLKRDYAHVLLAEAR